MCLRVPVFVLVVSIVLALVRVLAVELVRVLVLARVVVFVRVIVIALVLAVVLATFTAMCIWCVVKKDSYKWHSGSTALHGVWFSVHLLLHTFVAYSSLQNSIDVTHNCEVAMRLLVLVAVLCLTSTTCQASAQDFDPTEQILPFTEEVELIADWRFADAIARLDFRIAAIEQEMEHDGRD